MNENSFDQSISFIGGGNMARSIIGGLVSSGRDPDLIHVSDPSQEQRNLLQETFGVHCYSDNAPCALASGTVILAVKPQKLKEAVDTIRETLIKNNPLVISIAAGIRTSDVLGWIGAELPFVRVMPNTPALVNCGVSGLLANPQTTDTQRNHTEKIMKAVGEIVWVHSEQDIDTVTGISGSGPAYYFKLMEIMLSTAQKNGLDENQAKALVLTTALGAAKLAINSEFDPGELRRQVTSPGGTTEAAIVKMEQEGIAETVEKGIIAAIEKSDELARTLGDS